MHVVKPALKDAQSIRKMKRGKENSSLYNMGMVLFIKLHFLYLGIHLLDPDLDNFCGNMEMQNVKPCVFIQACGSKTNLFLPL